MTHKSLKDTICEVSFKQQHLSRQNSSWLVDVVKQIPNSFDNFFDG